MSEQTSTKIKLLPNGPIIVEGKFDLCSPNGNELAEGKEMIALCRCGASANKPFCDGAHTAAGFQG